MRLAWGRGKLNVGARLTLPELLHCAGSPPQCPVQARPHNALCFDLLHVYNVAQNHSCDMLNRYHMSCVVALLQ